MKTKPMRTASASTPAPHRRRPGRLRRWLRERVLGPRPAGTRRLTRPFQF